MAGINSRIIGKLDKECKNDEALRSFLLKTLTYELDFPGNYTSEYKKNIKECSKEGSK